MDAPAGWFHKVMPMLLIRFPLLKPLQLAFVTLLLLTSSVAAADDAIGDMEQPASNIGGEDKDDPKKEDSKKEGEDDKNSPEEAARELLLGMLLQDQAKIEAVILPHKDAKVLWSGAGVIPEAARASVPQIVKLARFRRLKVGERITLPNGREHVVPASDIGPDRIVLVQEGNLIPVKVLKVDDKWKIDPHPLIVSMKVAARLKEKNDEGLNEPLAINEPEDAVRELLIAMSTGNQGRVEAVIVAAEGSEILWAAPVPEKNRQTAAIEIMMTEFRRLQVGDKVEFPGSRVAVVNEKSINDDRVLVMQPENPFPFFVVRRDGAWKIDPKVLITLLKAEQQAKGKK